MNNGFARLVDGMIAALRQEVIPHTQGDFARGQAFGVIYMLEMMKRRANWSPAFLGEQLDALAELAAALDAGGLPDGAPCISVDRPADPDAMITARDLGDAEVGALIAWLAAHPHPHPHPQAQTAIDIYIRRQLRHELTTSARPMFAEISLGRDTEET